MPRISKLDIEGSGRLMGIHCSISGGVYNAPVEGGAIGCNAIQLFTGSNQQWKSKPISEADAARFHDEMKKNGIRTAFSHTTYLINLAAPDEEVHRKSIDAMCVELERCDLLEISFAVLHPGSRKDMPYEWGISRIADSINEIFERTHAGKARIALETTAGTGATLGSRFEELAEIRERVLNKKRLGFCLDTCHIFASGYELRTAEGYKNTWSDFKKIVGLKDLLAVHVNDSKFGLSSRKDRHENIGEGEIGLAGFKNLMNDEALKKVPLVLETPKGENPPADDIKNLKKLLAL